MHEHDRFHSGTTVAFTNLVKPTPQKSPTHHKNPQHTTKIPNIQVMQQCGAHGRLSAHQPNGNPELQRSSPPRSDQPAAQHTESNSATPYYSSVEVQQAINSTADVPTRTVPRLAPTPLWQPRPPLVTVQRRLVFDDMVCKERNDDAQRKEGAVNGDNAKTKAYQDMQRYVGAATTTQNQPHGATPRLPASKKQRIKATKPPRQPLGPVDINAGALVLPYRLRARRRNGHFANV